MTMTVWSISKLQKKTFDYSKNKSLQKTYTPRPKATPQPIKPKECKHEKVVSVSIETYTKEYCMITKCCIFCNTYLFFPKKYLDHSTNSATIEQDERTRINN